jgi:SAM-dependent methyltransferase
MPDAAFSPTVARLTTCRDATLAETYDLDMGRRLEDVPLWSEVLRRQVGPGAVVVEVGCGTGRVPVALDRYLADQGQRDAAFPSRWVGIDPDPGMVDRFLARTAGLPWCTAVVGDARDPAAWEAAAEAAGAAPTAVLVPYSTLYLLPHDEQAEALRLARRTIDSTRSFIAFEVFVPTMVESAEQRFTRRCWDPYGRRGWVRRTTYKVDAETRTTDVERLYDGRS